MLTGVPDSALPILTKTLLIFVVVICDVDALNHLFPLSVLYLRLAHGAMGSKGYYDFDVFVRNTDFIQFIE